MPEKVIPAPDVPPFVTFVTSAVPMVFDNSMSYYEALCALWKWLQDDVVDVINNNASVTNDYIDLTNEYTEKFIELKNYVDTYFDNLDVQEEINNKLDDMAEDGTLQELINNYLQTNVAWTFDTVADMKLSTNLIAGSYARTLGFHSANDGGGALYKITDTGTANGMDVIAVGSLFANLIQPVQINPQILGAYGDGTHDDTDAIALALTYGKVLNFDHNKTYLADINIDSSNTAIYNLRLKGSITFDSDLQFITLFNCDIDATDNDYGVYAADNVTKLRMYSVHVHDATLDNVHLVNCWDAILENVSSTDAGRDNFSLDVFNNGYLSGTSYFATNYGIKITNTKACSVIATVQECKKTGIYLNSVLGSEFRVYLEQNGYLGTTDNEKSQMLVGDSARCVGNNITFYAIGGADSDMESKYGIALNRSDDSTYQGFAEGHLNDGFRCYSNSHGNIYSVTDKTHSFVDYDLPSAKPQLYSIDTVTSNTLIDIDTGRDYQYIPVIVGTTAYMVSFNKQTSTQGLVRVTDYNGTNQTVSVNLFKYGSGIKTS